MANTAYFYKNVPLNLIYDSSGNSATPQFGYVGIPVSNGATNYNYLLPKPFGYSSSNQSLHTMVKAKSTIYSAASPIIVPTGCKSINIIAVGGGGGGGGAGGTANAENNYLNNNTSRGYGGQGGSGGYGIYDSIMGVSVYNNSNQTPITISITIGAGGNAGINGATVSTNASGPGTANTAKAPIGGSGGSGGTTTITVGGTVVLTANAGSGGTGGNGASASANNTGANASNGNAGGGGSPTTSQYTSNQIALYPSLGNYGNPGSGGIDAATETASTTGTNGAVQIIWLYD